MKKYIYGAGEYGRILLQCLQDIDVEVDAFVQSSEPENSEISGIPIISVRSLFDIEASKVVLIAIKNKRIVEEIEQKIYAKDDNITIYDCSSFVDANMIRKRTMNSTGKKCCNICNNKVADFLPAGMKNNIFEKHHIIGGGYRTNCICPYCAACDRERWIYYVIKYKTDISKITGRVLHFAPEKMISEYIKSNANIDYYTGDLVSGRAMHVTDITNIQYKDETFDYVICNHVMEHIPDEEKAVNEIKRVLKQNGKWIFSFPICIDMKTYEDSAITSPSARLEAYGQEDHVRLYGNDYVERFEKYGLKLQIFTPQDELEDSLIEKYGFIKDDVVIIATK